MVAPAFGAMARCATEWIGGAGMAATAYVDTFAAENLPPPGTWPEMRFDLPELQYPERLNCAVELLDKMVASGCAERPAIHGEHGTWTYSRLLEQANRIAHVLRDELKLVPGNRVLVRSPNNAMMAASVLA